jgi:hypothetical protein
VNTPKATFNLEQEEEEEGEMLHTYLWDIRKEGSEKLKS